MFQVKGKAKEMPSCGQEMVAMPVIEGLNKLMVKMTARERHSVKQSVSVQVGFTQNYALYVHENMEAFHKVGQAKYLETAARTHESELGRIARTAYKRTKSMEKALIMAGLRLQREAQKLTPVDTGALRASAYTAVDKEAAQASRAAFERSESIRRRGNR